MGVSDRNVLYRSTLIVSLWIQSLALFSQSIVPICHPRANYFHPRENQRYWRSNRDRYKMIKEMSVNSETNSSPKLGTLLISSGFRTNGELRAQIFLASQSPRRAEILNMMGLRDQFVIIPSPLDEKSLQNELTEREHALSPPQYAMTLADHKAKALGLAFLSKNEAPHREVYNKEGHFLIIGSDTIVDLDGEILEKPVDEEDARHMLKRLSGRWHKVHTGVSIYSSNNSYESPISSFTETAQVKFTELTDADIDSYIKTGEPKDKAGSYGIQGVGGQIVESIHGCFFCVMGLPMHKLSRELSRILSS